jgi:hypothetical protein
MTRVSRRVLAAVVALLLCAALFLPLCDLLVDCGCTWFFAGGSDHCNVHHPHPPHCPLCAGNPLYGLSFGLALWGGLYALVSPVLRRLTRT